MSLPIPMTGQLPDSSSEVDIALPLARWAIVSSAVLAALAVVASGAGLGWDSLYDDNPLVRSGWWGNDAVMLALGRPALVGATSRAARGSLPGRLAWLGAVILVYVALVLAVISLREARPRQGQSALQPRSLLLCHFRRRQPGYATP